MKLQLDWSAYQTAGLGDAYADIPAQGGDFAKAVSVCIGDKLCQRTPKGVMCPSFRMTNDIAQSPGGRVKILKAALNGELGDHPFVGEELASAMELCVGCKGCKRECANQVDMAAIKIEYQAQRNAHAGIPFRDRMMGALPYLLQHHRILTPLIRWRNRSIWAARLMELFVGVSAQRQLPVPVQSKLPASVDHQSDTKKNEVILFVDTFSLHFDPEIPEAAQQVLTEAGYQVSILQASAEEESHRPLCCGRTFLSLGQVEQARREARRLHAALRPALLAGTPIIGLEPSCVLSLRDDHLKLELGEDAVALSKQVYLFEEFVARENDRKKFNLAFRQVNIGKTLVHGHCHQKAVGAMKSMRKVLRLIPGFEFEFIEASCCGMAGSFGLEDEHAEISMQMAEEDLFPALRGAPEATILANGFSCRHQILEGVNRKSVHLAVLLRDALLSGGAGC